MTPEPEITGFKPEDQCDTQKPGIGIKLRDYAVIPGRKRIGVKRDQQVVEKPADDTAQTIDHGLRGKLTKHVQEGFLDVRWVTHIVILP